MVFLLSRLPEFSADQGNIREVGMTAKQSGLGLLLF